MNIKADRADQRGKIKRAVLAFSRAGRVLGVPFLILAIAGTGFVQTAKYKRLILKDGSYERITELSIREDRVRYFSSERHQWEDLPYSMIDWAATDSFAAEDARDRSGRTDEAPDGAAVERAEEEARSPFVAPGLKLPSRDGVFLLDFHQGKPELNRLNQNGADLKKNLGSNIIRGAINPVAGSRQTVELAGLHARVQSHTALPSLFVYVDGEDPLQAYTPETAEDHLRIVRCEPKKENRIVGALNIAVFGKVKQSAQHVDAKVEPVSKYWVRVSPVEALPDGEYALVEYDDKGAMNQFVWDFGVNPQAPSNTGTARPESERSEPVLIQKGDSHHNSQTGIHRISE